LFFSKPEFFRSGKILVWFGDDNVVDASVKVYVEEKEILIFYEA